MSQAAARMESQTMGNNARDLSSRDLYAASLPAGAATSPRARTPLSLVVSSPRRSRTPLVVSLFLLVVGALAAVLILSVSVSQGQYQLVGLKNQQSSLDKSNQALELSLASKESPQTLVARAAAMGMVPTGPTGQVDVRTKKVTGNPQPASADTKGLVVLPPADLSKAVPDVANTGAATSGATDGAAAAKPAAPSKASSGAQGGNTAATPAAVTPNLNGGTIPAPAQKAS